MSKKIPVGFQTCERPEYLQETVESFLEHNTRRDYELFYGDDASQDSEVKKIMKKYKVKCLVQNKERLGIGRTRDKLIHAIAKQTKAPYIMMLESDCKTIRPCPKKLVDAIFENKRIGIIRLFGKLKAQNFGCTNTDIIFGNQVNWSQIKINYSVGKNDFEENFEVGRIHWCFFPTITRTDLALYLVKDATREGDAMKKMKGLKFVPRTARPVGGLNNNFIVHIGKHKTPNRKH